jgi:hypothetical protein
MTLQLLVHRRPVTVSTDRVKMAYILNGTDCGNNTFKPLDDATPVVNTTYHAATACHTNYTLRSPHPFPRSLQQLSNHILGGGSLPQRSERYAVSVHHGSTNAHWSAGRLATKV